MAQSSSLDHHESGKSWMASETNDGSIEPLFVIKFG